MFMTLLMFSYGFNLAFCPLFVTHHMFPFQDQAESISSCILTRFSSFWFISVRSSGMTYLVCFSALCDNITCCFKSLLKKLTMMACGLSVCLRPMRCAASLSDTEISFMSSFRFNDINYLFLAVFISIFLRMSMYSQ